MYGKKIFEISENLGGEKRKFYVIPYKRRETYFQNNFRAIRFLKIKFRHYPGNPRDSRMKKKGVYFLIKLGILQPFLKKIWLSEKLGDIIFAGGQIKSFDLKKEIVTSFPVNDADKFVVLKESQKKLAKIGFAPKILEINKNFPLSREELLSEYWEGNDREVFRKLLSYYSLNKIGKISIGSYVNLLEKDLKKSNIEKHRIKEIMKRTLSLCPRNLLLKTATVHGDFAREQVLIKGDTFVFTDWNSERELITWDLILKFFRGERDLMRNEQFNELLEIYPIDVKENIALYIILNEISFMIKKGKIIKFSMERIKNAAQFKGGFR